MTDVRGRVLAPPRIEYGGRVGPSGEFPANDLTWLYCFVVEHLDVWWESLKGLTKNEIFMWWLEKITKDTTDLYFKSFIYLWGSLALSICVWSVYLCSPTCV